MTTTFDISPVISLLSALPAPAASPAPELDSPPLLRAPIKHLGDFSLLWEYLGVEEAARRSSDAGIKVVPLEAASVAVDSTDSEVATTPEKETPAKKTRHVGFDGAANTFDGAATPSKNFRKNTFGANNSDTETTAVRRRSRPVIRSTTDAADRKAAIIRKLVTDYPDCAPALLTPKLTLPVTNNPVHIFVDNSNVLIGFYNLIKTSRGFHKYAHVRRPPFSFHGLSLILERGRVSAKKCLVGSAPLTPVVMDAKALAYETSILERVSKVRPQSGGGGGASSGSERDTGKGGASTKSRMLEQAVDEIIHLKILESLFDYPPSTIVLASGDGAAGEYSPGFFKVVERCLNCGWNVELVSWRQSLSNLYRGRDFKSQWGKKFRYIPLDGFVEQLLD